MYREMTYQQERMRDMAHEAEEDRLRREAKINRAGSLKTVRNALGRRLIVVGEILIST